MEHVHHARECQGINPQPTNEWLDHIEGTLVSVDQHRTTNVQTGMPSHNKREWWQHQWQELLYSTKIDHEHMEQGRSIPYT